MTTYVVTKDADSMGRLKVVYAGPDPDEAKRVRDEKYEPGSGGFTGPSKKEAFIEVWEGGEFQFTTRENPRKHL